MPRVPQVDLDRGPSLDRNRFVDYLHVLPTVAIAVAGRIGGIGLVDVEIFLIDREDGESPGPALVVPDRDAG